MPYSITHKDVNKQIESMDKNKGVMCYVASKIFLDEKFLGDSDEMIFHNFEDFKNILSKYMVYNVEIHIKLHGLDHVDREKLKEGIPQNSWLKHVFKYDEIRIFTHAFNITTVDIAVISQSW